MASGGSAAWVCACAYWPGVGEPGQDEIGARSREMAPEQQLGVGNIDTVRVRCIDLENGRINPVAALD
jgi:hypothetical protein